MIQTAFMESLYLTTSDSVKIVANYFPVDRKKYPNPKGWVVFLHMMPATKESWNPLADRLQQEGYAGVAIDLRGHGASDGGPNGFREFSDTEHQDSIRDVEAAIDFLRGIGVRDDRIILVGASIGANLALQYIARHRPFTRGVLLSPGLDYYGIVTKPLVGLLLEGRLLLVIASRDDDRKSGNAADMAETLYAAAPPGAAMEKIILDSGGHGTDMLVHHPELMDEIITFIQQ